MTSCLGPVLPQAQSTSLLDPKVPGSSDGRHNCALLSRQSAFPLGPAIPQAAGPGLPEWREPGQLAKDSKHGQALPRCKVTDATSPGNSVAQSVPFW